MAPQLPICLSPCTDFLLRTDDDRQTTHPRRKTKEIRRKYFERSLYNA